MSWWFPQLNDAGEILSGDSVIWLNGQPVGSGYSPHWLSNSEALVDGTAEGARILNVRTGAARSLGFHFNARVGNISGISAGAGHWCGWSPFTGLVYDGAVVDPAAAPGAVDLVTGGLYYLTPYQADALGHKRNVVLNGAVVRNSVAVEIIAGDECATWGEYEPTRTLYGWTAETGVKRLSPLASTELLFTGIPVRTPEGLWLVTQTHKGLIVYPWGGHEGYVHEVESLYIHARWVNGLIVVVSTNGAGVFQRDEFNLVKPRRDLRTYRPTSGEVVPPVVVPPTVPPVIPPTEPVPVPTPPPDNGIVNGVVVDPKHYFQSLTWDKNPADFANVFLSIKDKLWAVGFGFQTRSNGTPTSRIFLPTAFCPNAAPPPDDPLAVKLGVKQDEKCWDQIGRVADTVENNASGQPIAWTWVERGSPAYLPLPVGTEPPTQPPTQPPTTPPSGDHEARIKALEEQNTRLTTELREQGSKHNLRITALEQAPPASGGGVSEARVRKMIKETSVTGKAKSSGGWTGHSHDLEATLVPKPE